MADKKKKVRSVKDTPRHKVGVVLGTGFFVILCAIKMCIRDRVNTISLVHICLQQKAVTC